MPTRRRFDPLISLGVGVAALLAIPLIWLLVSGFVAEAPAWQHIVGTTLIDMTVNSLLLATLVALGVMVVGTATAWVAATCEFPGRRSFEWLLLLPLAMPAYVMAYAYTDFLQYAGPLQSWLREFFGWATKSDYWFFDIQSLGGAATVLVFVLYPYVYLLGRVAFSEQSPTLIEAGRTFGYTPLTLFYRVSLPLARPAIIAGAALAVMETLADYGTVSYFGLNTFTTGIFSAWFGYGDRVSAARLALLLLAFVIVVVTLEQAARRRQRFVGQRDAARERTRLSGGAQAIAWLICALPITLGFVLPLLLLLRLMLRAGRDEVLGWHRFVELAGNSLLLAVVTALLAVMIGLAIAYSRRFRKGPLTAAVTRVVALGYAVPGTVIAVAVLIPVTMLDHRLVDWLSALSGTRWGLVLTGGIAALIYAYLIRFAAIGVQTIEAGFTRISLSIDDAARAMGADNRELVSRIHAPLLRGSLITAALLVFVDVMKELPATLVMRPFNFDTLAVHAYVLAKDERLAEASFAAIAIVVVGLIPVIVASRAITRDS